MTRYAKAPSARLFGLLLTLALFLAPGSASALNSHELKISFGAAGHGDGQVELNARSGVAVNEATHNVYVADTDNHRVVEFSAAGAFIRAFGADVGGAGVNVCTTGCGEGTAGSTLGALEAPGFIAVDNSVIGKGDVYVADSATNVVTKFEADGTLVAAWGTGGQLSGPGVGEFFGEIAGIAVDSGGTLDVFNAATQMFEFEPDGTFLTSFATERGTLAAGLSVDASGNFFKVNGDGSVEKFESSGVDLGQVNNTFSTTGIAVDTSSGELLIDNGGSIASYEFNGSGEVLQPGGACLPKPFEGCSASVNFGAGSLTAGAGLGVDGSSGNVYVADPGIGKVVVFEPILLPDTSTEAATAVEAESATLHGTISAAGGPEASCEFQIVNEEGFNEEGFNGAISVPCTPSGPFSGSGTEAVTAEAEGLSAGTLYFFRVIGTNEDGSNPDVSTKSGALSFRTLGPRVLDTGVTNITATAATVTGLIDPNGEATTYHIDYGLTESYGSSVPIPDALAKLPIATGRIDEFSEFIREMTITQGTFVVGQEISGEGIQPGTVVIKVEGSPLTEKGTTLKLSKGALFSASGIEFTSPEAAVSQRLVGLAPGTQYHARIVASNIVTSPGPDQPFTTLPRAVGGEERVYEMVSPVKKIGEVYPPEPIGALGGSCATFCLPGLEDITVPMQAAPDGDAVAFEGQPFSNNLAPTGNQYISKRSPVGWTTQGITPPLAASGQSDLQSGFKALSSDLSRGVVFQSTRALSPEAPPPGENGKNFNNLYRWVAGTPPTLQPLVTAAPPSRVGGPPEQFNGFELAFAGANAGTAGVPAFDHIVFEANDALTSAVAGIAPEAPGVEEGQCGGFPPSNCDLYEWIGGQLRLVNVLPGNEAAATRAVIGSGRRLAQTSGSLGGPQGQAADIDHAISDDGSRIFWSDESGQVYIRINGKETIEVQDSGQFLTASPDGTKVLLSDGCLYSVEEESCDFLGASAAGFLGIAGASDDLSTVYFVDTEALAPGAPEGTCETPNNEPGEGEEREGKVPAGLGCNLYVFDEGAVTFIASLNEQDNNFGLNSNYGSWKASKSNRTSQVSPDGRFLAFMSYAQLSGYSNRVLTAKCRGGSGPSCFEVYEYDFNSNGLSCPSCNPTGQRPLGRSNLSLIKIARGASFPQPDNLISEGEGRVIFESQDVLSPKDTNGNVQDIYEWTPNGVGSCGREAGCIALISTGSAVNDSMFLDATPSGSNAFFITRQQLVPQDQDELLDVYDARVGGGITGDTSVPCSDEGCKGPVPLGPVQPTPGSSEFNGPGNQKPKHAKKKHHKKHHHKKRSHKHHKKHAHSRAREASSNRGGAK